MGEDVLLDLKLGALVAAPVEGPSSTTLKLIMSTMLETSFLTLSGKLGGNVFPVSFKLQRYIASANSGKYSWPALVVSASVLFQ